MNHPTMLVLRRPATGAATMLVLGLLLLLLVPPLVQPFVIPLPILPLSFSTGKVKDPSHHHSLVLPASRSWPALAGAQPR